MTKRRKILILLSGVVLGAVLAVILWPSSEPSYKGKPLSYWVIAFGGWNRNGDPEEPEPMEALRQIGTNAIPYLLKWIQNGDPPRWKHELCSKFEKVTGCPTSYWLDYERYTLSPRAPRAFEVFGGQAKGAIPELSILMNTSDKCQTVMGAGKALGYIGEEALPTLMSVLTNRNIAMRRFVPHFISLMGTNAAPAVPALLNCLNDPAFSRERVTNALLEIDPEALKRATGGLSP